MPVSSILPASRWPILSSGLAVRATWEGNEMSDMFMCCEMCCDEVELGSE